MQFVGTKKKVRVFDVMINGWWLDRDAKLDIAAKLNLPTCYYYGQMTLKEAEEMVRRGFKSPIAENTEYEAEGLVLKPTVQLIRQVSWQNSTARQE